MTAKKTAGGNGHQVASLSELLALPLPTEEVYLPEFDRTVVMRAGTGLDRARLQKASKDQTGTEAQHDAIAVCLGATPEEVAKLPGAVIERLEAAALRLLGFEVKKELKATPKGETGSA